MGDIVSMALTGIGAYSAYRTNSAMAKMTRQIGEAQARQLEVQAGQERASAHRAMYNERERAALVSSRALALAGASGAGVSDASITDLLGDIDREGEIRALTMLYQGEELGRASEHAAALTRAGAAADAYAYKSKATQNILSGSATLLNQAQDLFSKYAPSPNPAKGNMPYTDTNGYGYG